MVRRDEGRQVLAPRAMKWVTPRERTAGRGDRCQRRRALRQLAGIWETVEIDLRGTFFLANAGKPRGLVEHRPDDPVTLGAPDHETEVGKARARTFSFLPLVTSFDHVAAQPDLCLAITLGPPDDGAV